MGGGRREGGWGMGRKKGRGKGRKRKETLTHYWWECKTGSHFGKQAGSSSKC